MIQKRKITNWKDIAKIIDHSMLEPDASIDCIKKICQEAISYGFATVAVNPPLVPYCCKYLEGSGVKIDSAVGLPLGQNSIETKIFETKDAIIKGADEIDFVINIVELKAGHIKYIKNEMSRIKEAAGKSVIVKAIIETCYLTLDEKKRVAELVAEVGLDYIKTSTGFGPAGARKEDVTLLRSIVGDNIGIKAAGEMTSLEKVLEMIQAGANRIGTKFSVDIIKEAQKKFS